MQFINYNNGDTDSNNGLIPQQDLMGLHEFTDNGNNPVEPFEDFRGRGQARRAKKKSVKQSNRLQRIDARKQGGGVVKNLQSNTAKKLAIKKDQAKANIIAAKGAGKSDPELAEALANSAPVAETPKSNTGLYVGIGLGVVVLGVGIYFLVKKLKKK